MTFLIMCLYLLVFYREILIAALTNSSFSKGLFMPWKFPFWSCLVGIWCVCRICIHRSLLSCVIGLGFPPLHLQFKGLVFGGVEHFLLHALVGLVLTSSRSSALVLTPFLSLIHSFFSNFPQSFLIGILNVRFRLHFSLCLFSSTSLLHSVFKS